MKAFRFNLERILLLRRYRERDWEIKLAAATGRCVQLKRSIDDSIREKARSMYSRYESGLSVAELHAATLYDSRLEQYIARDEALLQSAEQKRLEVQKRYLDVSKDRKVLDKLKERKSEKYRKTRLIEEIAEIDEISTGRIRGETHG